MKERQTHRFTDRQTEETQMQKDRQTQKDIHMDRKQERQTDIERHTYGQKARKTNRHRKTYIWTENKKDRQTNAKYFIIRISAKLI